MFTDKRSVHTDALETLGTIIDETQKRDAIHLAVEPVIAGESLNRSQDVCLIGDRAYNSHAGSAVGIVDPFLKETVAPGERFWLVVYPRKITSLRHVWEHPDFKPSGETELSLGKSDKCASEKWLRDFIDGADCPDYETVISTAIHRPNQWDGEYLHFDGLDAHGDIPPEFWDHLEVVTGVKFAEVERAAYFSCSC